VGCVTRFQVLRGTTAQRLSFTPLSGELIWDETMKIMYVGDNVTVGGIPFSGEIPAPVIVRYTASGSLTGVDYGIMDSASSTSLSLPDALTYTKPIRVKNFGAGVTTLQPTGGQLIDENTDVQLRNKNAVVLVPKLGRWYIW